MLELNFLFKTYFLIVWGLFFGLIYIITLLIKKKSKEISLYDFITVLTLSISVIIGFRLIYNIFINSYLKNTNLDMDNIYIVIGGITVIWNSIRNILKKLYLL